MIILNIIIIVMRRRGDEVVHQPLPGSQPVPGQW